MTADIYADFAEGYDLFFGDLGKQDPEVVQLFRRLFPQPSVRTVLDCACGRRGQRASRFREHARSPA